MNSIYTNKYWDVYIIQHQNDHNINFIFIRLKKSLTIKIHLILPKYVQNNSRKNID